MIPQGVFSIPKNQAEAKAANEYLSPIFKESVAGMTTMPRGDISFARQIANAVDRGQYINPQQFDVLLKIAKNNLNIPKKVFNKMNTQQLLQELLGLAQTPR